MNATPVQQRLIHRLVYKALPQNVAAASSTVAEDASPAQSDTFPLLKVEGILVEMELSQRKTGSSNYTAASSDVHRLSLSPRCWETTDTELDLLLPDR